MSYTIYKGLKPNGEWKIGCDEKYPNRPIEQNMVMYYALEVHGDIYIASTREIELQKQHKLKVDRIFYYQTREIATKGGITTGNRNRESGFMSRLGRENGSKNALISCEKRHITSQENIKEILNQLPEYFSSKQAIELSKNYGYTLPWTYKYLFKSEYVNKIGYNQYKNNLK